MLFGKTIALIKRQVEITFPSCCSSNALLLSTLQNLTKSRLS